MVVYSNKYMLKKKEPPLLSLRAIIVAAKK